MDLDINMKPTAYLNRAIIHRYLEFGPSDGRGRGGNVFHGVDSLLINKSGGPVSRYPADSITVDEDVLGDDEAEVFRMHWHRFESLIFEAKFKVF